MVATHPPASGRQVRTSPTVGRAQAAKRPPRIYSPFSPEAAGLDLAGMDLSHPPTPADDEMHGVTITPDMVKEWPKDHRDRWKTNGPAYRQFSLLCESHERHRHKPVPVHGTLHLPYGFFLLNSVMGSGKNVIATFYAAVYYAFGWPVSSTSATKFGKHIGPSELYHFAVAAPLGMFYLADEVHAIFHSNTTGANREVSFQDNATSMRKREATFLGMSASKRISPTYKAIVDWIGYVHPLPYAAERGGNGWKETWKYVSWYGPRPYDRDDFEEENGFRQSTNVRHLRETFHSDALLESMKLMDSWADVRTMFGDGYSAEDERTDRKALMDGGQSTLEEAGNLAEDPRGIARMICNWLAAGHFQSYEDAYDQFESGEKGQRRKATLGINRLAAMFGELGGQEVPAAAVRRSLEAHGVDVTQRGNVGIEEIVSMYFQYQQAAQTEPDTALMGSTGSLADARIGG